MRAACSSSPAPESDDDQEKGGEAEAEPDHRKREIERKRVRARGRGIALTARSCSLAPKGRGFRVSDGFSVGDLETRQLHVHATSVTACGVRTRRREGERASGQGG